MSRAEWSWASGQPQERPALGRRRVDPVGPVDPVDLVDLVGPVGPVDLAGPDRAALAAGRHAGFALGGLGFDSDGQASTRLRPPTAGRSEGIAAPRSVGNDRGAASVAVWGVGAPISATAAAIGGAQAWSPPGRAMARHWVLAAAVNRGYFARWPHSRKSRPNRW
ncbi:MAG: hypothetical protein EXR77_02185 [Myxococcales bacterium]|nr:hypothetical protein [Myxococcales bacterium]